MQQNNELTGLRYFRVKESIYVTKRRNNGFWLRRAFFFFLFFLLLLHKDFAQFRFEESVFANILLFFFGFGFLFCCWKGSRQVIIDPVRWIGVVRYPFFYRREYDLNDFTCLCTCQERKFRWYYPWTVEMKFKGHELISVFEDSPKKRLERKKGELIRVLQFIRLIK